MSTATYLDPVNNMDLLPAQYADQVSKLAANSDTGLVDIPISDRPQAILRFDETSVIEKLSGLDRLESNVGAVRISVKASTTSSQWLPVNGPLETESLFNPNADGDIVFNPMIEAFALRIEFVGTSNNADTVLIPSLRAHACKQGVSSSTTTTTSSGICTIFMPIG